MEKNAFAGLHYSWSRTIAAVAVVLLLWWIPWWLVIASFSAHILAAGIVALVCEIIYGAGAAKSLGLPYWYGLVSPVSVGICAFALLRSAALTTLRGGVVWRRRHYPLNELKKYDKL
ncbi:MAG: hypothetical protein N2Z21_04555 [Candidatus Sumerlaeaceae bacterium]|nr:hypothetical protein [Candidatus Sumerlaeaceae bacterium]